MPDLPFTDSGYDLTQVDHDPFAPSSGPAPSSAYDLVPVDHQPFDGDNSNYVVRHTDPFPDAPEGYQYLEVKSPGGSGEITDHVDPTANATSTPLPPPAAPMVSDEDLSRAQIARDAAPREGGLMQTIPQFISMVQTPEGRSKLAESAGSVLFGAPTHDASGQWTKPSGGLAGNMLSSAVETVKGPSEAIAGNMTPEQQADWGANTAMTMVGAGAPFAEPGAAGIFGGKLAKTADLTALKQAEEMHATGAAPSDIWDKTGWFQGADKQWRFEIPDKAAVFNPEAMAPKTYNILGNEIQSREGVASNVLTHPELFNAYPDAANMTIGQVNYGPGTRGIYHSEPEMIGLEKGTLEGDDARSTMLHELQHAVQQREGFSQGSSPTSLSNELNPDLETYKRALVTEPELAKYKQLRASPDHAAELESQNQLWRQKYQPLLDAIDSQVKSRGDWERLKPQIDEVFAASKKDFAQRYPIMAESDRLFASLRQKGIPTQEPKPTLDPFNAYRRTAGEVEARNVQTRADWNEQKRRDVPPSYSQDVPFDQQIVRLGNGTPLNAVSSENIAAPALPMAYPLAPRTEWYGEANYADHGGEMTSMSPDEFLAQAKPLKIDESSRDNIDDLKRHMQSGRTLDPLKLFADGKEDGRHRAIAAKELGIKQVPVVDFRPPTPAPPLYSAVAKAVDDAKINKAPASQWLGTLKNMQGVKQEEIDWIGLPQFLQDQKGPITKQQVADYVRQNQVQVNEVRKVEKRTSETGKTMFQEMDELAQEKYNTTYAKLASEQKQWVNDKMAEKSPTKFGSYIKNKGENYGETLLTLPERGTGISRMLQSFGPSVTNNIKTTADVAAARRMNPNFRASTDGMSYDEVLNALNQPKSGDPFKSPHWDEPNVLANVLHSDKIIDGKKYLDMHELQSDWAQKGHAEGFNIKPSINELPEGWKVQKTYLNGAERYEVMDATGDRMGYAATKDEAVQTVLNRYNKANKQGVPDMPMKNSWHELALKQMVRHAAENGYDGVLIDNGATVAGRYDLSKQVNSIQVAPRTDAATGEKTHSVLINLPDGHAMSLGIGKDGVVDNVGASNQEMKGKKLDEIVGKEMASKILHTEGKETYAGEGLKVGGEFHKKLYDEKIPQALNKIGKKYGAKVSEDATQDNKEGWHLIPPEHSTSGGWIVKTNDYNSIGTRFAPTDGAGAKAFLEKKLQEKTTPVHKLDITPALRKAAISQGFPMFKRGGRVQTYGDVVRANYREKKDRIKRARGGIVARTLGESDKPESQEQSDWDQPIVGVSPTNNDSARQNSSPEEQAQFFKTQQGHANGGAVERAHGGRVEAKNINHNPTPAQKHANNYAHDKIHILGLKISIENAKGSYRGGIGPDGKPWKVRMPHHYGYLNGTLARDGDHVDAHIGPHTKSPHVFVIDQVHHETGKYDEPKIMLCFANEKQAIRSYEAGFSDGKGKDRIGKVTATTVPAFKNWLERGNTKAPFRHPEA